MPDLLFQIKSDSKQAAADLKSFAGTVSTQVAQVNQTYQSGFGDMSRTVQNFGGLLNQVAGQGDATFSAFTRGITQVASAFANSTNPISIATTALGAFIGVGLQAAEAQERLIKDAIDYGSRINDLSVKTGLTAESLSGLDLATKQSGTSIEALSNGIFLLQKNVETGGPKVLKLAESFGITKDSIGDTEDTLRKFFEGISKLPTEAERNAAGAALMGKSYKELSVFLADTGGDIDGVIAKARQAGLVMSNETARSADHLGDRLQALQTQAEALRRHFGEKMFPQLESTLDLFSAMLKKNKEAADEWADGVTKDASNVGFAMRIVLGNLNFVKRAFPSLLPYGIVNQEDVDAARQERVRGELTDTVSGAAERAGDRTTTSGGDLPGYGARTKRTREKKEKTPEDFAVDYLKELTNQLKSAQTQYDNLTDKTIRQRVENALTDKSYQGMTEKTRNQILATADLIDQWKNQTDKGKLLQKTHEDLARFITRLNEEITKETGGYKSNYEEAEKFIDSIYKQGDSLDKVTLILMHHNALLADSVELEKKFGDFLKENTIPAEKLFGNIGSGSTWKEFGNQMSLKGGVGGNFGLGDAPAAQIQISTNAFDELGKKVQESLGAASETAQVFGNLISGVFGQVADAVGSAVQSFVLFGSIGGSFKKFAAELIASLAASATVQAAYEAAQGLAWLALNYFFPNPRYAAAASTAFASAAAFGLVAGATAIGGRVLAASTNYGASSGNGAATVGNGARQSTTSGTQGINTGRTTANPITVNRPVTASESRLAAVLQKSADDHMKAAAAMNAAANRIYGASAADVVRAGARGAAWEIATAWGDAYELAHPMRNQVRNDGPKGIG